MGKTTICIGENKNAKISFAVTAKLISAFVFATQCLLMPILFEIKILNKTCFSHDILVLSVSVSLRCRACAT